MENKHPIHLEADLKEMFRKREILTSALTDFHDEVRKLEVQVQNREARLEIREMEILEREQKLKEKERTLLKRQDVIDKMEKDLLEARQEEDIKEKALKELRLERKEMHLAKLIAQLQQEGAMVEIGRTVLNKDISEFKILRQAFLEEEIRKKKAEKEAWLQKFQEELQSFKLPSAGLLFKEENEEVEVLVAEANGLADDCLKLTLNN